MHTPYRAMYTLIYAGEPIKQATRLGLWRWLRDAQHPPLSFLKLIAPDGEVVAQCDWHQDYKEWLESNMA